MAEGGAWDYCEVCQCVDRDESGEGVVCGHVSIDPDSLCRDVELCPEDSCCEDWNGDVEEGHSTDESNPPMRVEGRCESCYDRHVGCVARKESAFCYVSSQIVGPGCAFASMRGVDTSQALEWCKSAVGEIDVNPKEEDEESDDARYDGVEEVRSAEAKIADCCGHHRIEAIADCCRWEVGDNEEGQEQNDGDDGPENSKAELEEPRHSRATVFLSRLNLGLVGAATEHRFLRVAWNLG